LTEVQVDEIRRLYVESRKPNQKPIAGRDFAKMFNVTPKQISRILKGGWGKPNLLPNHGNAKLTPEQIAAIPARLAAGLTQKDLAAELGVSHSLVNLYANQE